MEYIGIGILIALGIYLAPVILTLAIGIIIIIIGTIGRIFGGK